MYMLLECTCEYLGANYMKQMVMVGRNLSCPTLDITVFQNAGLDVS